MRAKIKANAELVIQQLTPLSGINFGYNSDSVAWLDHYIEQQRTRPDLQPEDINGLVNVFGSFLGECIIRCFGGRWFDRDGEWVVCFDAENMAFPFNKIHKQFLNGTHDSIHYFFETIPLLFQRALERQKRVAHMTAEEKLETFIRQAEEAYDRLYDEWSRSGRAAAYNECKENMAEAIHLARDMGLGEKVAQLEKRLQHIKAVFRHQMDF
jgi:hypothetical protein